MEIALLTNPGYGYSNEGTVNNVVQRYRDSDIPLDGMHLDVDFQACSPLR